MDYIGSVTFRVKSISDPQKCADFIISFNSIHTFMNIHILWIGLVSTDFEQPKK